MRELRRYFELNSNNCRTNSPVVFTSVIQWHFQFLVSTYFLKLFKMACQPSRCISIGLVLSASKVVAILVLVLLSLVKITCTFLPSEIEYTINSFVFTCS